MSWEIPEALCPRCYDDPALDVKLLENAADYAASLPEDVCVDDAGYRARLTLCAGCANMRRGVCVKCGCFVIVRARRKHKACPAKLW